MRHAAEPSVSRVRSRGLQLRLEQLAKLDDFNFFVADVGKRPEGPQGVFYGTQVADDADPKPSLHGTMPQARRRALHDDVHFLAGRKLLGRLRLQDDQPVGELEGLARFLRLVDVAVDVRAGESQDDRAGEGLDRSVTAARVQREHRVGRRAVPFRGDRDPVPGGTQERRPAQRGVPVAAARSRPGGRDERDSHLDFAA